MITAARPFIALILLGLLAPLGAKEFTVLVFNVENLFDVDGKALYDDYSMPAQGGRYTPDLLGKKLEFITDTLTTLNDGDGPEVVLFQELERDQSPESLIPGVAEFLDQTQGISLEQMLTDPQWSGLPSYAFLLKAMQEAGLEYPYLAVGGDPKAPEEQPAHINALVSRYPILFNESFETTRAREVLVVTLDVEGHPLTLVNNHWKSGASDPGTEAIRVENALTVRRILDFVMERDPRADLVIAGDLNSYYDQSRLFPGMKTTGINTVLGSQGDEQAVADGEKNLYNLWFEIPQGDRYSETWRDRKGTLMNILIAPGLYDNRGIRYVDNSFEVLRVPGLNVDQWGRPTRFSFAGEGRGGSDHLPILARFEVMNGDGTEIVELVNPGREADQPGEVLFVNYDLEARDDIQISPMAELLEKPEAEWDGYLGELFRVSGTWGAGDPISIQIGDRNMPVYAPDPRVEEALAGIKPGAPVEFVAEFGEWKGDYQWVVRASSWIVVGRRGLEPRTN
tara:strand:- start:32610 stop:34139 length:1530 start_codon:yes stop_codon:yes gene_type:complete